MIISDSKDQVDTEDQQTGSLPISVETALLPRKIGPYEFFQTPKGRKISWYLGIPIAGIATLSALYTFLPKPASPIAQCSRFVSQDQRFDCMLEMGTISIEDRIKMAEAMRIELASETKGIPREDLPINSQERRFEEAVISVAADNDLARREALILIRDKETRSEGFEKLASLSETTEHLRQLGELTYPWDTARATLAYEKAIENKSDQVWDYIYLARLYQRGANLQASKLILIQAQNLDVSERDRAVISDEIGDVAVAQGDLTAARTAYEDGLKIRDTLAQSDPTNTGFQRDLSVSYERIGDVARAQGDLTAARTAYEDGLKIRDTLAQSDPTNTGFQRDLSGSYNKIGDVARAQGDLTAARTAYEDGLKIANTLAQFDPTNARFQRDLMVSHWKLAQLDGEDAASHWQSAYDVLKALDVAGKMQPVDQTVLEFLENKAKTP